MKDQLEKIEKRLACIEENTRLLLLSDVMRELDKSTDILEDKLLSEWLEQQRICLCDIGLGVWNTVLQGR